MRLTLKPIVTAGPEMVPEYVPDTVPRADAGTYPWRPRLSMKLVSKLADGADPVVTARAYLETIQLDKVK